VDDRDYASAVIEQLLSIGSHPDDDPELRIRKWAAVASVYAVIFASAVLAAVGIALERPQLVAAVGFQIVVQCLNLVAFARTRRVGLLIGITIVLGLSIVLAVQLVLGGVANTGFNLGWALITPMVAVLYFGPERSKPFAVLFAAAVLLSLAVDLLRRGTVPALPYPVELGFLVMNVVIPGIIAFALVRFIDGERVRARAESDALLLNVMPSSVAHRLKSGENPIADQFGEASVLFADVVDFTAWARSVPADALVSFLDELFSALDRIVERAGLEKIKTVGDAYMAVAGVPTPRDDHAESLVEVAIAMQRAVLDFSPRFGRRMELRIGIASGPVVAGVIGQRKFHYDLWGDTVNTASRMESTGEPGCIQVTAETWTRVKDRYAWTRRDEVEVKGKGRMTTYLLNVAALPG
jgi:adenylate cyclase